MTHTSMNERRKPNNTFPSRTQATRLDSALELLLQETRRRRRRKKA